MLNLAYNVESATPGNIMIIKGDLTSFHRTTTSTSNSALIMANLSNLLGGMMKEMNPNDFNGDWNWPKLQQLGT
jgi:hypothetical protein